MWEFYAALGTPARMGYYNNYLVDNHSCIIVGVQATGARLSEESRAAEEMIARFAQWQGRKPQCIGADATYGNGEFLQWLMDREITPYMPTSDAVGRTRSPFYWEPHCGPGTRPAIRRPLPQRQATGSPPAVGAGCVRGRHPAPAGR